MRLKGLGKLKKKNTSSVIQTGDVPAIISLFYSNFVYEAIEKIT
jgi:hypothetical protein